MSIFESLYSFLKKHHNVTVEFTTDDQLYNEDANSIFKLGTEFSACNDIRACLPEGEITIIPGGTVVVPTGIHVKIPNGYEMEMRPRSGLAAKHSIFLVNGPGTIDSDYRGEVKVILGNFGQLPFVIKHGDRIAQVKINEVIKTNYKRVIDLDSTNRGTGGFGHTGVK